MNRSFLGTIIGLLSLVSFSQTTIYSEDFTGQQNKGAIGPGGSNPTIDLDGVDWSIDVSDCNLANANDFFIVRTVSGNQIFEGRDLDGNAIWFSPSINIDGFTDVSFSLEATESNGTGGNNIETSDIMTTEYRIDGGAWIVADTNGTISDDYDLTVVSQEGLDGSTLELRITIINNGGGERMRFDNIEVSGNNCSALPIPFSENFDASTELPSCWTSFRGTNGDGAGFDWLITTAAANSAPNSAFVRYENVSEGTVAQDWLVTPAIDLGTNPTQLSFFARQQFTNEWNTDYTVRVSTTSQTDIASFTTLITYGESDFGFTFSEKIIDLSSYTGIVYVAFVMEQDDGDNWYIDNVSIDELPPCTVPDNVSSLTADYVSGNIDLVWDLGACYDELLIVAKEGSAVTAVPTGDGTSYTGDTAFGNGTEIAPGEFVVYKGGGNGTTISNVVFGNTYFFEVFTRKGTSWSSGVTVNLTLDCTVTGDTTNGRWITSVSFGDLNNVTANGPGYSDFTASVTAPDVRQGNTVTLSVSVNTNGSSFFGVHVIAWIDWNQDGIFDIATEQYDIGDANDTGPTSLSPAIIIPADAVLGETVMRVICRDRVNPDGPCEDVDDGEIEDYAINILEGIDYIYDNGWTPEDPNGIATIASDIIVSTGDALINSNTVCNSFTVNPGATLTINSGIDLNVIDSDRGLTLESSSSMYSSFINDGSVTGTVNYERYVNIVGNSSSNGGNDLISVPLMPSTGQSFDQFIQIGSPDNASKLATNGVVYAFAPYNNTSEAYENYAISGTNSLTRGIGYRVATNTGETLTFSGEPLSTDLTGIPISTPVGGNEWNLVGNPYPSYLSSIDFLTLNASSLDPSAVAIYGYNSGTNSGSGTTGNFTIINFVTNSNLNIAPGQGFFLSANNTPGFSGTVDFTSSMRTIVGTDDFIEDRIQENFNLRLKLTSNGKESTTDIYFHENGTPGLDPGYDAILFDEFRQNIYSYLINGDSDKIAIQTLDKNKILESVIPLGFDIQSGKPTVIEIDYLNLPSSIEVYLQDTLNNQVILLNNSSYSFTPSNSISGGGRYNLLFQSNSLSNNENQFENIRIYQNNNKQIVINGPLDLGTKVDLFDLQGRLVKGSIMKSNSNQHVLETNGFSTGVYILRILSDIGSKSQKIIIN